MIETEDLQGNDVGESSRATEEHFEQNGLFLKIALKGLTVQDFVKQLRESDILVAIDGRPYLDGPQNLRELFKSTDDKVSGWLLTFWRDGQIFDLLVDTPVESRFGLSTQQETEWAKDDFANHIFGDFQLYQNYEIYRDRKNVCDVLSMEQDPLALWFPLLWCLKYRILPPAGALMVCYALALFVNFYLFIATYLILSRFVFLSQENIIRSFTMFEDKTHYMTIAATSEKEAAAIVRKIDPVNRIRYERHAIKTSRKASKKLGEGT
jgi:hypothetical protein